MTVTEGHHHHTAPTGTDYRGALRFTASRRNAPCPHHAPTAMAKVSIPLPTLTQGAQPWIISGKELFLSFACSGSKAGDGFCDTASKGGIKKMLLAKEESFFSDPKAPPGLQT